MVANKPITEEVLRQFLESQTEHLEGKILEFKVEILGEIKSLREEVHVTAGYRDLIANNEKRIEKLENQVKHLQAN